MNSWRLRCLWTTGLMNSWRLRSLDQGWWQKKINASSSSASVVHTFLPRVCPQGTLSVSKQLYNTEEKVPENSLRAALAMSLELTQNSFLRVRQGSVLPGHQECSSTCKGWMDLNTKLISYKVLFNQRAQNAITNNISLILRTRHTFRLQEMELFVCCGL